MAAKSESNRRGARALNHARRMPVFTRRSHVASWLIGGSALGFAGGAAAHSGTGLPGGFVCGLLHPLAGLDHVLAMVCVGLWGAVLGRPLVYLLPVVFPSLMVAGAALAMLGVPLPPVQVGIACSVVVLGACIALSYRAPVWAATLIVAGFAIFHGYAHGQELPSAADPIGYSLGFVLATGLLHVLGICLGFLDGLPHGRSVMRGAGAIVSMIGVGFVWQSVGL